MSFLLPPLVLLVASTAVLLATRVWKARKCLRTRRCRAAPGAPGSPPAEETPGHGPAAPERPLYIPCGCGPCCTPCAAAARELQDLVTPLWPEVSFPRDSEMWQLLWQDLEQLLEQGQLPCCASSSLHPSRSLSESCRAPAGEGLVDGSRCSLAAAVAGKSLEVKLSAQPGLVRHSQERLVQREASPPSPESLPRCGSRTADSEDASDRSPSSSGSADISEAREALRMHVAKKSLEVKLGARPALVRSSQQQAAQQEGRCWCRVCSPQSAAGRPRRNAPRSHSQEILQRQRELEFPYLQGAPPSRIRPLLAAQILLRMLCYK